MVVVGLESAANAADSVAPKAIELRVSVLQMTGIPRISEPEAADTHQTRESAEGAFLHSEY